MNEVYLVGGVRTPIGKTGGMLRTLLPETLGAAVLNEVLARYALTPETIDQVLLGNAVGPGGNIARVCLLAAGWPYGIPAMTVDTQCGSGLSAVNMAASLIKAGEAEMVVAGGVESTSLAPRRQFHPTDSRFAGPDIYYERAPFSTPAIGDPDTGEAAEKLAELKQVTREEMDALALESHRRATRTRNAGMLKDILLPLFVEGKTIDYDECIRDNMSAALLRRMPSVFAKGGSVTAGNTCLKHDGAAVVLLASAAAVKRYGLKPAGKIVCSAIAGCDPNWFPLSPVPSIRTLLDKAQLPLADIAALEINEAFAVKILTCCRELGYSLEKTNILGGALAYGHPYGASGAIILLHLLKALEQQDGRFGVAAIGAVGGQGISTLLERI